MPWQHHSAVTRRDEQLARTRRLTIWIAGSASAASFVLAAALGFALPGHAASSGTHATHPAGSASHGRTNGQGPGSRSHSGRAHRKLAPPAKPPANSGGAPAASSGGS